MDYKELIDSLEQTASNLKGDTISEIDFARLQSDLCEAAGCIKTLSGHSKVTERLIELLRQELGRKAKAIARLQGRATHVAERMLGTQQMNLSELLLLRQQLEDEFDNVFSQRLIEPSTAARRGEKRVEFGGQ